uniref:serine C-palmitoyltransferase n=1 Tax=Romanomermis culicivorax TaxID=13658 RepID=A0A915IYF2_ROMCU
MTVFRLLISTANGINTEEETSLEPVKKEAKFLLRIFLHVQCVVVVIFAYIRELLLRIGFMRKSRRKDHQSTRHFPNLYNDFISLFSRNIYGAFKSEIVNKYVTTAPDRSIDIFHRRKVGNRKIMYRKDDVVNFGSYNYLGFSQNCGPCARESARIIRKFGLATCSSRHELGSSPIYRELERSFADFLGVEDSICFAMGFVTNMSNIGCLVGPKSLILSDQFNHSSLVSGCRLTRPGVKIQTFKHNNMIDLENRLIEAITGGRKFDKILVCVEGIYSMEGTMAPLPKILELKRIYKFYLYLDEAHSIGALGANGRGVCDYFGVDPQQVDILMGTFTKGFGSVGGYIAGRKCVIDHLRAKSPASCYGYGLSAPCAQQVITSIKMLNGHGEYDLAESGVMSGKDRIKNLAANTRYFQNRLKSLKIPVYGHEDSPVVTVPVHFMTKIIYAYRAMLDDGVGIVVVAYPATPIMSARIRFCLSALHTKRDLDKAIDSLNAVIDVINIRL